MGAFGTLTLACAFVYPEGHGCEVSIMVDGPVIPSGWKETEHGAICPRHRAKPVEFEDVPAGDVADDAWAEHQHAERGR